MASGPAILMPEGIRIRGTREPFRGPGDVFLSPAPQMEDPRFRFGKGAEIMGGLTGNLPSVGNQGSD